MQVGCQKWSPDTHYSYNLYYIHVICAEGMNLWKSVSELISIIGV